MNVAALLQDSPSDERRRNGSIGSSNNGNYSNNSNTYTSNQQASHSNNRDTNWASTQNQHWQQSSGGWKDSKEAGRNSPGLASRGRSGSSPQMQAIIQGVGQGMGIGPTRNPPRLTHNPTLSQPTPPQQASPLLPPASSLPRGGVWGPGPSQPPGPDSRGEQSRIPDSTALPRRDYMDRERDRERDQPRILNIMDWQGERPRSDDGRRRPHPGGPGELRDSQSPVMPSMSRLSSSGSAPVEDSIPENDGDYIRSVRRHRSSRSGSAPTDSIKSSGPITPRSGDFPYQPFQPPSHFGPGLPIPAPIPAPAPGTLALVPPQHQHSHQQHQLAQAQAQQQQIHVNAQGPTVLLGPTASVVGPAGGSTMSVMEPRGGTIVNLNGPTPPNPPQKQFQNQFHTQFLPGLQLGPPGPGERRERDPSRDRDWERDERDLDYLHHPHSTHNSRRGSPLPGSRVELSMGMGMGVLVPDRERDRDIDHRQRHPSSLPSGPSRRHPGSGHPSAIGGFGREKELRERERERDRDFREREFRERDREAGYRLIGSGPGPESIQHHSLTRGDPRDVYHHLERERIDRERERERDRIDRDRERADAFHRDRERERDREQRERERSISMSMMGLGVGDRDRERERDLIRERERTRLALIGDVSPPGPNMSMDDVHVYGMNDPYMPPHVADPRGYNPNHNNNNNNSLPIGTAMGLGPDMMSDGAEELPEREVKSRVKIELGTYVWPKSPFPYFFGESKWSPDGGRTQRGSNKENESTDQGEGKNSDKMDVDGTKQPVVINLEDPPSTGSKDGDSDKDLLDSETLVTIVIPNGFIPLEKPKPGARKKYRIWGGGVVSPFGGSPSPEVIDGIGYREREHEQMRGRKTQPLASSHQHKPSLDGSNPTPTASSTSSKKPLRRRRIYTDDSDIFLCAIHSGWVSWSGAKKAREEGKDLKLRLRVIRCLGVREDVLISAEGTAYSLSASGLARRPGFLGTNGPWVQLNGAKSPSSSPGKGPAINGLGTGIDANVDSSYIRSTRGKEEVVARFMGGMGEKYFGGDIKCKAKCSVEEKTEQKQTEKEKEGKTLPESKSEEGELKEEGELDPDLPPETEVAKNEPPKVEEAEEPVPDGGPEDDGRSLLSAGWGIGHDGSGIEVVDAEFISRQITRSGIRNRSQRLLEYAERRANIFASDDVKSKKLGPFVTNSIAGRKRSRGIFEASYPSHTHISRWDSCSRRQPNAVSLEAIIEEDESGGSVPIVLSNDESGEEKKTSQGRTLVFGRGAEPWYKYTPEALRATFSADGDGLAERPTKRKKIDNEESTTASSSQPSLLLKWDDSDRCCLVRTRSIDAESPKSTRFALFITQQSRVKDHLSYRFPESTPTLSGDVVMNGGDSESTSSPMEVVAAIGAASLSPLRQLTVDDWVVQSHCVHTSEEDVWLLGLDSMQFVDTGINISRTRTIPVTRWKFVSVS